MRISDWSSDVCSSDLGSGGGGFHLVSCGIEERAEGQDRLCPSVRASDVQRLGKRGRGVLRAAGKRGRDRRSEEHTSELQSLMRISYAVFCLKKKKTRMKQNLSAIQSKTVYRC